LINVFKRKYDLNEEAFSKIDEDSAYWLGFLFADGYIYENRVRLRLKEGEILDKYKEFLGTTRPTYIMKHGPGKKYIGYEVGFRSTKIVNDLKRHGFLEKNKDRTMPLMEHIYEKEFIRGYFDGDGCFYIDPRGYLFVEITGYEPILNSIKNILLKEGITKKDKLYKNGSILRIRICASESLVFAYYIYNSISPYFLERKRNLFTKQIKNLSKDRLFSKIK